MCMVHRSMRYGVCMVYGVWFNSAWAVRCMVCGVCGTWYGVWCMVCGVWYMVHSVWSAVHGVGCMARNAL
jgi:hypothetical protein